jgi:hypothetical protein
MGVYHVSVGRKEKREWWDSMTSLKVTWALLRVPLATVDVEIVVLSGPRG